jgi:hypothetical protein
MDGRNKGATVEVELTCEQPDVVEVLHPAIQRAEEHLTLAPQPSSACRERISRPMPQ